MRFVIVSLLMIFFILPTLHGQNEAVLKDIIIKGIIITGESHEPIPLSVVRLSNSNIFTLSDEKGKFELIIPQKKTLTLEISAIGYRSEKVHLSSGKSVSQLIVHLYSSPVQMQTVVVTGNHPNSKFDEFYELTNVLQGKDLQRDLGMTLASTLKNETGLAIRSMGPAPARPVIRGLGGDRILISEDGIKTNDLSASSPDHAVSIEPFTVDRIEVLRGPKILLQNSSSIGGIVNIIREEIPVSLPDKVNGNAGFFSETANKGFMGAFVLRVPILDFSTRIELSKRKTDDIKTPNNILKNSNSESLNYSFGLSKIFDLGHIGFSIREYFLEYGVPGGFIGAHPNGVDISMFKRTINAEFVSSMNNNYLKNFSLKLNRTFYRHIEYEQNSIIGAEFGIYSYEGSALFETEKLAGFQNGSFGLSFETRDFNIGGYVFTSPTKMLNLSAFIYQTAKHNDWNFEISARTSTSSYQPRRVSQSAKEEYLVGREFFIFSASTSALYELTNRSSLGATISRSARIPTIEELYSEGPHLAAYSYEIGNPKLSAEKGYGLELFYYYKRQNVFFTLTGFYNNIESYLIPRNSGKINFATLLPIYETTEVDAQMYGFETQSDFKIIKNLELSLNTSFTKGMLTETEGPLPSIPPLKGILTIKHSEDTWSTGVMLEMVSGQNKVDYFEQPTAGYVILNSFIQLTYTTGKYFHNFSLNVDNIFNAEYRNHLSRVKQIMPEAERNFRITYRVYF